MEIGCFHNERIALPMAARVSLPQADALWKMWTTIQWDDADVIVGLDNHRHISGSLDDLRLGGDTARNLRRSSVSGDAARVQTGLRHVNAFLRALGGRVGLSFPRLWRQRRNSTIRRIHNQRRAQVRSAAALPGI